MMNLSEYAEDVSKSVDEIKALCDKIGITYEDENRYGVITDFEETNYFFDKRMFKVVTNEAVISVSPLADVPETLMGEIRKLYSEVGEFSIGSFRNDTENTIEEFYDVIQVMVNIMDMINIPVEYIEEGQIKHRDKLISRGWKFKDK